MSAGPIWAPSPERVQEARITKFMRAASARHGLCLDDYAGLYDWSIDRREDFWHFVWDWCGVRGTRGEDVLDDGDRMPGSVWFPGARLNFAENLLRRRDEADALVFRGEDQVHARWSFRELYDEVSRVARGMRAAGVRPGDRIAGFMANMPESVIAMLATASIGAIWCSCSPDFGVRGVIDRFGQIAPKLLFAVDGYWYNGNHYDCLEKLRSIMAELPTVERLVMTGYTRPAPPLDGLPRAVMWEAFSGAHAAGEIEYARLPFDHPLYIMFSSGTTGVPKCIVHGAGGTLLQHLKEHMLHTDIRRDDRVYYFTTCSWMMWNWLVSALASEAVLLLYDGSPFHPGPGAIFEYADAERMTAFGTSAKYLESVAKSGLVPRERYGLASVRTMLSTGSPLAPESFDFVYQQIKADLCLSSISGGTDIISCFALGAPILPVWRGELQCRGLGMAVEIWDEESRVICGERGELVCVRSFPSMPIGFWNDPDGAKYRAAYFERYPGVWCHGDYAQLTEHGGLIIYGRSDAILNPGGVRIGTAEIYRQVEQIDEVLESLVIAQEWENDVRIVLFVKLRDGRTLDNVLATRIRMRIRENTTPRHVPAKILQVAEIPRTKSGKIVELAVREIVHGRPVKNVEALANPHALDDFRDRIELKS